MNARLRPTPAITDAQTLTGVTHVPAILDTLLTLMENRAAVSRNTII